MEYQQIAEVCGRLFESGLSARQISFSKVREALGRGSKGDILQHIRQWKETNAERLQERDEQAESAAILDTARAIEKSLKDAVHQATAKVRSEYEHILLEAEKRDEELASALTELETLRAENEKIKTAYQKLIGTVETLKSELEQSRAETRAREAEAERGRMLSREREDFLENEKSQRTFVDELRRELAHANSELEKVRNENENLKQDKVTAERDRALAEAMLKSTKEHSAERISDLQKIIDGQLERIGALQDDLAQERYERKSNFERAEKLTQELQRTEIPPFKEKKTR